MQAGRPPNTELRVLTWNLETDWCRGQEVEPIWDVRSAMFLKVLKESGASIAMHQEVNQRAGQMALPEDWNRFTAGKDQPAGHQSVLWNGNIWNMLDTFTGGTNRYVGAVLMHKETDAKVIAISAHLRGYRLDLVADQEPHSVPGFCGSLQQLEAVLKKGNTRAVEHDAVAVVVGMDGNFPNTSAPHSEAICDAGFTQLRGHGETAWNPHLHSGVILDHLLVKGCLGRSELALTKLKVGDEADDSLPTQYEARYSDHRPVAGTIFMS